MHCHAVAAVVDHGQTFGLGGKLLEHILHRVLCTLELAQLPVGRGVVPLLSDGAQIRVGAEVGAVEARSCDLLRVECIST